MPTVELDPPCRIRPFDSYDEARNCDGSDNGNGVDDHLDVQIQVDVAGSDDDCTLLRPFEHQVGGHTAVMKLDGQSVCKPENATEVRFYRTLPAILRDYVPLFKGMVDVYLEEEPVGVLRVRACPEGARKEGRRCIMDSAGEDFDSDEDASEVARRLQGNIRKLTPRCCVGEFPTSKSRCELQSGRISSSSTSSTSSFSASYLRRREKRPDCCRVRVKSSGNLCIDTSSDDESSAMFEDQSDTNRSVTGVRNASCNPWSMHCHLKQFSKMHRNENAASPFKFMVLEDCTSDYHFPCILDLKIGTRSHNDRMSEGKKRKHVAKVTTTTSATVGVRAAGMQIFNVNRGRFVCRNKYYGRRLNEQGLREALCKFLHNGRGFRYEVIPQLCKMIQRLIGVIRQLPNHRFYGSSLLLIYEGLPPNMASLMMSLSSSSDDECMMSPPRVSNNASKGAGGCCSAQLETPMTATSRRRRQKSKATLHSQLPCMVSLKMIDFASVSISEDDEGPDNGYIYGLQNLLQILRHIEDNVQDNDYANLKPQFAQSFPL